MTDEKTPDTPDEKEEPFYDLTRDGVTYSLLRTFLRCRVEASLMLRGITPNDRSEAMDFGTLGHSCLEVLYLAAQQAYEPFIPNKEFINAAIEECATKWAEETFELGISPEEEQKLEIRKGILYHLLPAYCEFWKDDFTGAIEWLAVEHEFDLPSPGHPDVPLRGKMDGRFQKGPKSLWLFENKFKQRIEADNIMDALPLDLQVHMYLYALAKETKRKPKGVLYNIIRRPALKQKKDEKVSDYIERIGEDIRKRPEFYFIRYEVAIMSQEMKDFQDDLEAIIDEYVRWARGKSATYKNGAHCLAPFRCRYLPICGQNDMSGYWQRSKVFPELGES